MKTKLFAMAIAAMSLFASCDKCKKADCQNDATCEKKKGDCVCTDFYEGTKCETEVRKNYYGTFKGTASFTIPGYGTDSDDFSMRVESYGGAKTFQMVDPEDASSKIYCELTSKTAFKITGDTDPDAAFTGTGTISSSKLTISGTITMTEQGLTIAIPVSISASK